MSQTVTILVIDDHPGVPELVGAILEEEGARVLLAASADEGLELVRTEAVDILFTDLLLPGDDGITVIRKSLQLRPHLASIVFTGAATLESAIEALRLGACDYITKPVDCQKIVSAFRRAVDFRAFAESVEQPTKISRMDGTPPQVNLVAASGAMRQVVGLAAKIASSDFPVLIQGETGVGKKLLARSIHCQSTRACGPFIHVACAALSDTAPESELFGCPPSGEPHGKQQNHFAKQAGGSTLFLEGVDELPLWAQVQLLNVLEGSWLPAAWKSISRFGDARVIASTTVDLKAVVSAGRFHRGLYDHLNLMPIEIPPLRERREDIQPLAIHFLEQFHLSQTGDSAQCLQQLPEQLREVLPSYHWPGNVRELASVVARVALVGDDPAFVSVLRDQLQTTRQPGSKETISVPLAGDLKAMERHLIREVVRRYGGNKAAAARALGMHRRTLYRVLEDSKSNPRGHRNSGRLVGSIN